MRIQEMIDRVRRKTRLTDTVATTPTAVIDALREAYQHYINAIAAIRPDAIAVLYADLELTEEFTPLPAAVDIIVRVEDRTTSMTGRGGVLLDIVPLETCDSAVRPCCSLVGRTITVTRRIYDGRTLRIHYRPDIEEWEDFEVAPLYLPPHFHEVIWRRAVIELIGLDGEPSQWQIEALRKAEVNAFTTIRRNHPAHLLR